MSRHIEFGFLFLAATAIGCGTTTTTNPGVDLGTVEADLATVGPDMAKPDLAVPPTVVGNKIATGNYYIIALTTDDKIAAFDNTSNALVAFPATGGMVTTVDANPSSAGVRGKSIWSWDGVDQTTQLGTSNVWVKGKVVPVGNAAIAGIGDTTADEAYIYYSEDAAEDGTATDLYVAKSDMTGKFKIATAAACDPADEGTCAPNARFTAGGKLVITYCETIIPDGGVALDGATMYVIDPATGVPTKIAGGLDGGYFLDPTGTNAIGLDTNGNLLLLPLGGGAVKTVDADVKDFFFTPDGSAIVWNTNAGVLKRATVAAPTVPTTLVSGVGRIQFYYDSFMKGTAAFSPDGKLLIVSKAVDGTTGLGDLQIVSATAPGNMIEIAATKGVLFGDAFTTDSTKAIFIDNAASVGAGLVGKLEVVAVTGGAPTAISAKNNEWVNYLAKGSVVVYNDNWKTSTITAYRNGQADLKVVDVSAAMPVSKLLANGACADIFLTHTKDLVVFYDEAKGVTAGVYAASTTP